MERLEGPINPCLFGEEHLDLESLEQEKIPFLEMLQTGGLESPAFSPFGCDLSFQALLSFQQYCNKPPWDHHPHYTPELMGCSGGRFTAAEQPDSCLTTTHDVLEMELSQVRSETKITHSICDGESSGYCCGEGVNGPSGAIGSGTVGRESESGLNVTPAAAAAAANKEKRKRVKRTRASEKNKEEVESQRMTHIAVERNRRRQMNDHLAALRSLMPSSYIQRGDQASIIGGAIDYVKELEQLLQSLQSRKRMRKSEPSDPSGDAGGGGGDTTSSSTSSSSAATDGMLAASSQCRDIKAELGEQGHCSKEEGINVRRGNEFTAEKKTAEAEVRVTVIQNHVNLKVECPRRAGQLLDAIVAFEDLGLTVLHLTITSLEASVHYSFNLKIEEGCELGSAEGIAMAVHQIFSFINGSA